MSQNYSQSERIQKLNDIYDKALDALKTKIDDDDYKGTAAMVTVLERSRIETAGLSSMTTSNEAVESKDINITFEKAYPSQVSAEA